MKIPALLAFALPAVLLLALPAGAANVPDGFADEYVIGNLEQPASIAFLPDGRLFVIEQKTFRVRLVVSGAFTTTDPVATLTGINGSGDERGLLGIAVDPGWPARPYVYTHATAVGGFVRISRYTATGDLAFTGAGDLAIDPASRYDLLVGIPDAANNHNGGTVRFGPDGKLYVSLGEDANQCAAQDTTSLRGVILRLEVANLPDGPGGPPERALITPAGNPFPNGGLNARLIWAFGLRNPFRFHIDPASGVLFIGDVGQSLWEEIDRADHGGIDFGWPLREGPAASPTACVAPYLLAGPIAYYDRTRQNGAAVVSAGVYHAPPGAVSPFPVEYEGDYFFSDYYTGALTRLTGAIHAWNVAPPVPGQPDAAHWATGLDAVSDYSIGPGGALWYCVQFGGVSTGTGEIRRIVYDPDAPPPQVQFVLFDGPVPSPAVGATNLEYSIMLPARAELSIFDVRGQRVRLLQPRTGLVAGRFRVHWDGRDDDGRDVPPAIYFARLTVDAETWTRRIPFLR